MEAIAIYAGQQQKTVQCANM